MEFYRRLFVLRGKPSRSVHSTETSFSFTLGTTVRFYCGAGRPPSPAPTQEAHVRVQKRHLQPWLPTTFHWRGPHLRQAFFPIFEKTSSPFSFLPGRRPKFASFFTNSRTSHLHHLNARFTRRTSSHIHTHTHTLTPHHPVQERGCFNGRSVILRKRPNSVSIAKIFGLPFGGKFSLQKYRHDEEQTRKLAWLKAALLFQLSLVLFCFLKKPWPAPVHETFYVSNTSQNKMLNAFQMQGDIRPFCSQTHLWGDTCSTVMKIPC